MEASVSNLTSPGDRVLVLTAGKFGERWMDLTKAFGCQADVVKAPYGQTFDLAEIKKGLKPEHKAVYMQATETSTAVRHELYRPSRHPPRHRVSSTRARDRPSRGPSCCG